MLIDTNLQLNIWLIANCCIKVLDFWLKMLIRNNISLPGSHKNGDLVIWTDPSPASSLLIRYPRANKLPSSRRDVSL